MNSQNQIKSKEMKQLMGAIESYVSNNTKTISRTTDKEQNKKLKTKKMK